jgi:hypothetical protein
MATVYQVLSAVSQTVQMATEALPAARGGILNVQVGIDWPSTRVLQQAVKGGNAIVAVFDRKLTRNTTRWIPTVIGETLTPATLTTVASSSIPANGSGTITLGGSVTVGDAVSCVLMNGTAQQAAIVSGFSTDTPATMAAKLAAAINADPVLATWVSATSNGSVVTVQSLGPSLLMFSSTGNNGSAIIEIGRRLREIQIACWASTVEDRNLLAGQIDTLLSTIEAMIGPYQAGLVLADGTSGYLKIGSDYQLDDATLSDAYRHDFMLSVDHGVTTQDALYSVLAPIIQYN